MAQHLVTALFIAAAIACTVLANLMLKTGAQSHGIGPFWPLTVVNAKVLTAAAGFAMAFLFYTMTLKRMPLSLAQAIFSVQFVLVILAASLVLQEEIGTARWIGIALMAVGLAVVGLADGAPGK
jgi:drug/metabolite transporter (DMT)-like permease